MDLGEQEQGKLIGNKVARVCTINEDSCVEGGGGEANVQILVVGRLTQSVE